MEEASKGVEGDGSKRTDGEAGKGVDGDSSKRTDGEGMDRDSSKGVASNAPGSWKKALFSDLRQPKKFRLRFIPPAVRNDKSIRVCNKSAIEGELAILDLTLVGFFIGRRPSFSFVKAALLKQWKIHGNVEIIQMLQGGYAFRFSDVKDRDSILEGDAYYVGGQPLFLRAWDRNIHSGGILGLRNIPLWVSFPGLPLHLWGEEALSTIGSVLGTPLYSDQNTATKSRLAFARVCIDFMGDKPLLETITIEDEMGLSYEQKVVYDGNLHIVLHVGFSAMKNARWKGRRWRWKRQILTPWIALRMEKKLFNITCRNQGSYRILLTGVSKKKEWRKMRTRAGSQCGSRRRDPATLRSGIWVGPDPVVKESTKDSRCCRPPIGGEGIPQLVRPEKLVPYLIWVSFLNFKPIPPLMLVPLSIPVLRGWKMTFIPLKLDRWTLPNQLVTGFLVKPCLGLQRVILPTQTGWFLWLGS